MRPCPFSSERDILSISFGSTRYDGPLTQQARTHAPTRVLMSSDPAAARSHGSSPHKCVICGKQQSEQFRPFCSKRCADLDLHRWLSGHYAIRASDGDEDDLSPSHISSTDS